MFFLKVVNEDLLDDASLSSRLNQPKILIDYILDILASRNFFKVVKTNDSVLTLDVTVQGKRAARQMSD